MVTQLGKAKLNSAVQKLRIHLIFPLVLSVAAH